MTGAYSNIMDTDMATEMTEYAADVYKRQRGCMCEHICCIYISIFKVAEQSPYLDALGMAVADIIPVSYTHLDVYKRQVLGEATADDIVTLESDNIPVTIENLSKLIAARGKDCLLYTSIYFSLK